MLRSIISPLPIASASGNYSAANVSFNSLTSLKDKASIDGVAVNHFEETTDMHFGFICVM